MKTLHLISRRCNRRDWIQIRLAGDFPWDRNLTAAVNRLLANMRKMGLITASYEGGPQFHKISPVYRLTPDGRSALQGR